MNYWLTHNGRLCGAHYNGADHTFIQLKQLTGISDPTIRKRAERGWSVEDALNTTPVVGNNARKSNGGITQEDIMIRELSRVHSMRWVAV